MAERPGVRRSRMHLDGRARLTAASNEWHGDLIDVSLSGMRVTRPDAFTLPVGHRIHVAIESRGRSLPPIEARIARLGEDDIALAFEVLGLAAETDLRWVMERFGKPEDGL